MTAQIIQFRDYQIPRDLAPMHGDVETSLAELNHMAAEVFNALMIDTAPAEYSVPKDAAWAMDWSTGPITLRRWLEDQQG